MPIASLSTKLARPSWMALRQPAVLEPAPTVLGATRRREREIRSMVTLRSMNTYVAGYRIAIGENPTRRGAP